MGFRGPEVGAGGRLELTMHLLLGAWCSPIRRFHESSLILSLEALPSTQRTRVGALIFIFRAHKFDHLAQSERNVSGLPIIHVTSENSIFHFKM